MSGFLAGQAPDPDYVVVPATKESELIHSALLSRGASDEEADSVATLFLEADLRGIESHGIRRLRVLVDRIAAHLAIPGAEIRVLHAQPGVEILDGGSGIGPYVASKAMERAMDLAEASGIALVGVTNNNHIGILGWYTEMAATYGYIGIATTTTEPFVRPYQGRERLLGTNPIAIAVPTGGPAFALDMSTSATAIGRLLSRREAKGDIPADWAVDRTGAPTTDPQAALDGAINPAGGAKGYGLGLGLSLIVALLTDTPLGDEVVGTLDAEHPVTKGDVFIAIRAPQSTSRVSDFLGRVRGSKPAPDFDRVLVPGDRARETREQRLADGIPHPRAVWESAVLCAEGPRA